MTANLISAAGYLLLVGAVWLINPYVCAGDGYAEFAAAMPIGAFTIWVWHMLIGRNVIEAYIEAGKRYDRPALALEVPLLPAPSAVPMAVIVEERALVRIER